MFIGGTTTALWYWLYDDATPTVAVKPQLPETAKSTVTELSPSVTHAVTTTQTSNVMPSDTPAPVSEPSAETPLPDTADPEPTVMPAPVPTVTEETPPTPAPSITNPAQYSATIERDEQGLTITLDAPADDPVFTQQTMSTTADATPTMAAATTKATNTPPTQQGDEVLHTDENSAATTPAVKPAQVEAVEIIHIVVKGDTLWHIARRYVNNPFRYPELARLSKIKNPDLIYPGNRVRILKRKRQP